MNDEKRHRLFKHLEASAGLSSCEMADALGLQEGTYYYNRRCDTGTENIKMWMLREMRVLAKLDWKGLGRIIDTIYSDD